MKRLIRRGPLAVRELSWEQTRSLAVADNYGQGGTAGVGPIRKAVFQGFASGVAFSDDSQYFYGQTQEGGTGTFRIPLDGIPQQALTEFVVNNEVYNNLRSLAQRNGTVVSSSSTGALVARAFDAVSMNTKPGWSGVDLGVPSHACEVDELWAYFGLDANPGGVRCVAINNPTAPGFQITAGVAEDWNCGVYSMSLDPNKKRLAVASNDGIVYLWDLSPLLDVPPHKPRLLAQWPGGHKVAVLPGTDFLFTIGLAGIHDVATWDISDPAHPRRLGTASYTGDNPGNGYGSIVVDKAHALVYLGWPGHQDLVNGGTDVLRIDPQSMLLSLQTKLAAYRQGGTVFSPDFTAISPDGNWYAYGSSGSGAPGAFAIYDVSAIRDGREGALVSEIPANNEPRGSTMNDEDDEPFIYTAGRYSFSVNDGEDELVQVVTPGYVTGNKVLPFGTTARGYVPGVYLVPGQGFQDTVITAARGKLEIVQNLGNSTMWDGAFDGQHLIKINKSGDYYNGEVTVHPVDDDYAVGPAIDRILLPHDKPFSHGTVAISGRYGEPKAQIWVAADPVGVVLLDASAPGQLADIAGDPVYYSVQTPGAGLTENGSADNANMLFRFVAYYMDKYGAVLGVSELSEPVRTGEGSPGFQIAFAGDPPPLADTVSVGASYSWDGATWYGPSPCPEAMGLAADVTDAHIWSSRTTWFGAVPQPGLMFPSAGHVLSIVLFPEKGRAYVAQGDEGIRVYKDAPFERTAQLLGWTQDHEIGIAAPGMAGSNLWNGATLASMHYTSLGSGNGIRFHDVATNPDDPPYQHIGLCSAGFTCTAINKRQLVLANTVAGPVALTCRMGTWEPCPEPSPCRGVARFRRYA